MDIITLVAVSILVTERILVHIITGLEYCKSKCCCSCEITEDHDNKEDSETIGIPWMEIPKKV
jgi:hypothetical protein